MISYLDVSHGRYPFHNYAIVSKLDKGYVFGRPSSVIKPTDNLSEPSKRILGVQNVERFESFKRYAEGWGGGSGRSLSFTSTAVLELFIAHAASAIVGAPNLFMALDGHLELSWRDNHNMIVEVGFFDNEIEYYIESSSDEGAVAIEDVKRLVAKLSY